MFYLDLFKTLQEERVHYVVVGGLAINLHGVERATMDVDLVLAMDEANLRRFLKAATRLKLKPSLPVPLESLCDAKQVDDWVRERRLVVFSLQSGSPATPTVDIVVRPALPFDRMYRNRIEKDVGGVRLNLARETSVAKIDYEYETTEERVRAYSKIPEIERLRWLEELCAFTSMVRQAPTTYSPGHTPPASEK